MKVAWQQESLAVMHSISALLSLAGFAEKSANCGQGTNGMRANLNLAKSLFQAIISAQKLGCIAFGLLHYASCLSVICADATEV